MLTTGSARTRLWAVLLAITFVLLVGCGGAAESTSSDTDDSADSDVAVSPEPAPAASPDAASAMSSESDADVTVVLGEWIVEPTPTSGTAGSVAITADNQGGEAHEMVVVRADDPADLPTDDDGAVDESQIPDDDLLGEIEEFPEGEQRSATFDMDAGTYVLFCNITETEDDGEVESHFAEGMATTFVVQ